MIENELPPRLQTLYDALAGRGDVAFETLCDAMGAELKATSPQNWLTPYITRLNRRLARRGLRVKTGDLKRTYRLVVV